MENNGKSAIKSATLCRASLQALLAKGRGNFYKPLSSDWQGRKAERGLGGKGQRQREADKHNESPAVCLSVCLAGQRKKQTKQSVSSASVCVSVCVCVLVMCVTDPLHAQYSHKLIRLSQSSDCIRLRLINAIVLRIRGKGVEGAGQQQQE